MLSLIIFAALAAVVLFQLYSVLGRRVGRQPEDLARDAKPLAGEALPPPAATAEFDAPMQGLAALRARDPSFDSAHFLDGARQAYQMIVRAFAEGDRESLKRLLSPQVYTPFEAEIAKREAEARTEKVEFLQTPRADLQTVTLNGDIAQAEVRFLAEYRSRSTGPEGEAVDDKRTAELWTFERNLKSRDPNWALAHVDAADA